MSAGESARRRPRETASASELESTLFLRKATGLVDRRAEARRALDAFGAQFTAKWRQRTTCAPEYGQHEDCSPPPSGQGAP